MISDCREAGLLNEQDQAVSSGQVDVPCAYVVHDHARADSVACIRDWLAGFDIVLAGRYAEWVHDNAEHPFVAGRKAAEQSRAQLQRSLLARAS